MGLYLLACSCFHPCFTLDNNNYAENSCGGDIMNPYISLRGFHIWLFSKITENNL